MGQIHSIHERISAYSMLEEKEIFDRLKTGLKGLEESAVDEHRERYGRNQIVIQKRDTYLYRLRRAFINPFSIVLFLLALISMVTDAITASDYGRNITTVIIIMCMLLISGIVRFVQEMYSKRVADSLIELINTTVQVMRGGTWREVSADELVVGDMVRLEAGDRVPADIRIVSARDFFVSQAVITGESGILEKVSKALITQPAVIKDYVNTVFLGSTVTGGTCTGIVLAVGRDTMYGDISPFENKRKRGYDRGENSIAWVLIRFMATLVPIVFIISGIVQDRWLEAFLYALSVAVGLTPELLPMVITACLSKGSYSMGQKQTVVKNINAMQGFGSMDVLCVDKTGTLTGDTVLLEYYMDVLGNESAHVLDIAYINSHYHTGVSNHLDKAILKALRMPGKEIHYLGLVEKYQKIDEFPFDYNRKFASVLVESCDGRQLFVKGNVNEVVNRCKYIEYKGQQIKIGEDSAASVHAIVDEMLEDGMKVLAVACKSMDKDVISPLDETDMTLLGYLAFFDAPKQSAAEAIMKLKDLHIGIKVLTGDHEDIAASVCRRLNIGDGVVITGAELDKLAEDELIMTIEKNSIFSDLTPKQKARIVEILQGNGHTVGFLGDGLNDLPAVIQADVGISVDTAMDAIKESADVILLKKDLNVLDNGVREGRKAFANMSKYIRITASSNFGNICAIVVASILLPFFPMTSVQLLMLNLLYDILCLILPWDNVDAEAIATPQEWSGRTLGRFMRFFGPISSVFDVLTFAFLYFYLCPLMCEGSYGELGLVGQLEFIAIFRTGWFLESMWTQVWILQLLRTRQLPFIQSRPAAPVMMVTVFGLILFTMITVTPVGTLLGLTVMPGIYFAFLGISVLGYLLAVTCFKKIYVNRYKDLI